METVKLRSAVVVAAHRMYETMGICIHGLLQIVDRPTDVIFVDNGSGGSLTEWAGERYPGITVLTLDTNRLFCGGYNAGIRHAIAQGYDYVLIVNADSEVVNPRFLDSLVAAMESHPKAAFIGPKVFEQEGGTVQTTCLHFPSLLESLLVWLPFRFLPRLISRQPDNEHEVEYLNGICVLCRIAALREIGLMDETFGGYFEDADWSWRAREKGWKSVFTPVPSVIHHVEPHGYEHHSFKVFLLKRNTVYWFLKANKRFSARGYALVSVILAFVRLLTASTQAERLAKNNFLHELRFEYRRLLRARPLSTGTGLSVPLLERARHNIQEAQHISS